GSCGSILQYINALYVLWIDEVQRVGGHSGAGVVQRKTIDNVQRSCAGTHTAHTSNDHILRSTWLSTYIGDIDPCYFSLKQLSRVHHDPFVEVLAIHRGNGTCNICLSLGTVPNHDHIFQKGGIRFQLHIDGSPASHGYFLGLVPQIGNLENGIAFHINGKITVKNGDGAISCTFFQNGSSCQGHAIFIRDLASHGDEGHFDHPLRDFWFHIDGDGAVDPPKSEVGIFRHKFQNGTEGYITIGNIVGIVQSSHLPVIHKLEAGLFLYLF